MGTKTKHSATKSAAYTAAFLEACASNDRTLIEVLMFNPKVDFSGANGPMAFDSLYKSCGDTDLIITAFWHACETGDEIMLNAILRSKTLTTMELKKILNSKDEYERTGLMHAVTSEHNHIVTVLVNIPEVDINLRDEDGWTALFWAVAKHHVNIVKTLLQRADLDLKTTIHFAYSYLTAYEFANQHNRIFGIPELILERTALPIRFSGLVQADHKQKVKSNA